MSPSDITVGIDVGGTFTDFVLLDGRAGRIVVEKCLTTPQDPSVAIMEGLAGLVRRAGVEPGEIHHLVHGTTLVTNTIIQRNGAKVGLLTTEGFRDVLEMGNDLRYDLYDLLLERPEPLVPRYLRREAPERLDPSGRVTTPLDIEAVRRVARFFQKRDVAAVAVCFLHSFRNPVHERQAGALLREEFPQFQVSLSSEVAPEIREYERTSTTVANAYVQPLMRSYLVRLAARLETFGLKGPLYVMLSSGGTTTLQAAGDYPIRLIESGPAGGATAALFYSRTLNAPDLISFDMGGTTAKTCLVTGFKAVRSHSFEAARVRRFKKGSGLALTVPVIEMIEIGAGGGSIAHVDAMGLLKVGPESAGAMPGPACYGQGGELPTVTDADLVLGHLDPEYFLGGAMKLEVDSAERAITTKVAEPLGMGLVQAALGIHDIVNENMAGAARMHIAERGLDPQGYSLVAFGGAGPVHAYRVAKLLKLSRVICPLGAGATSALGFLVAPIAFDFARSYVSRLEDLDWDHLQRIYRGMEESGRKLLAEAGIPADEVRMVRTAEMRYAGQGYEVSVPMPEGRLETCRLKEITDLFYATYDRHFGRHIADVPVEALTWRLVASGPVPRVDLHFVPASRVIYPGGYKGRRRVYIPEAGRYVECPVYERQCLAPGATLEGPAIVQERESTVVVGPEARARIDEYMNLLMTIEPSSRPGQQPSCTTGFSSTPTPSTSATITSPSFR